MRHNPAIVQTRRIAPRYQTRLEKLLTLFEQLNFVKDNKESYKYYNSEQIIGLSDKELQEMTDILHYVASTDKEHEALCVVKFRHAG